MGPILFYSSRESSDMLEKGILACNKSSPKLIRMQVAAQQYQPFIVLFTVS